MKNFIVFFYMLVIILCSREIIKKEPAEAMGLILRDTTTIPIVTMVLEYEVINIGLRNEIFAASARTGLNPELIDAFITVESGGDPLALSSEGAVGPMQLIFTTAKVYKIDRHNTFENILGGALYLRDLLRSIPNFDRAILAYRNGPGNSYATDLASLAYIQKIKHNFGVNKSAFISDDA